MFRPSESKNVPSDGESFATPPITMNQQPSSRQTGTPAITSGGFCRRCGRQHLLGPGNTVVYCQELMQQFTDRGTIDLFSPSSSAAPVFTTNWLFGPARGKMFGIMECLDSAGNTTVIRAFSGQYNGHWLVEGWAPPLFDVDEFNALCNGVEKRIKNLTHEIDGCETHTDHWLALRGQRRLLSRQLMQDIHSLYTLTNFRGETVSLAEAFIGDNGIPTGTGDCCGPKLLGYAARNNLRPIGLAEFFWGQANLSGSRQHFSYNSSCTEKCQPILGFMLCGLEDCISAQGNS